jgi:sugar/nucleoside kinase (ribokinase family)
MKLFPQPTQPEYLIIGHLTRDLLESGGSKMGGTVTYAGLTALALGNRVRLLTSCSAKHDLSPLTGIELRLLPSENITSYKNISQPQGRVQYMFERAERIMVDSVPIEWTNAPLVHLGPIADEIEPQIFTAFPNAFIGITPQGWLRGFGLDGRVHPIDWHYDEGLLKRADATVLSLEDLGSDPAKVAFWRSVSKVLVITHNKDGATVYRGNEVQDFPAPAKDLVEDTGAGDVFSACFFHAYAQTGDPFLAAPFAVDLAADSVTRQDFASIPTQAEVLSIAKKYGIQVGKDD